MSGELKTSAAMSGSKIVWTMLLEEGIDHVFGVCGISNVPLLHALKQIPEIKFIHAAHESVAMGMADGYARATGKVAVVVVHDAAGLSNAMGNLQNAFAAGSRILVIAGQTDSHLEWSERFMDLDCRPMVSQVTKGAWNVTAAKDAALAVNRALKATCTPSTGPVFIAISTKAQSELTTYHPLPATGRRLALDINLSQESLESAAQLLAQAERPIIMAGRIVADTNSIAELVKLAEVIGAPVYIGNEEKLIFPTNHPLYRGTVFQHSHALQHIAASADVLLMLGNDLFRYSDYSEQPIVAGSTKVIQIDLDAQLLGKFCATELSLLAHPKLALDALADCVGGLISADMRNARIDRWSTESRQRKTFVDNCLNENWQAMPIRWGAAFKEIAAAMPEDAIVVDEIASFYGQLSKVMEFKYPGSYFAHCDALGWGLPAALGVAMGNPNKPVIAMLGDGATLFCIQALWTAAKYQIPVVIVVFNNSGYGCMRNLFKGFSHTVAPVMDDSDCETYDISGLNYSELAANFGIDSQRVSDPTEIKAVIEARIARKKPAVVELMICPNGSGLNELVAEFFK